MNGTGGALDFMRDTGGPLEKTYAGPPPFDHVTNWTLDRSCRDEGDADVLLRQSPAQTKMPTVSPSAGWRPISGPQRES